MEQSHFPQIADVASSYLNSHQEYPYDKKHVDSGFPDLDRIIGGFYPGDLIILGGRPGVGKSDFAMNIARMVSFRFARKVAFFSLQNSRHKVAERILSAHSGVAADRIRIAATNNVDETFLAQALRELAAIPLFVNDDQNLTVEDLHAKTAQLSNNKPTNLLIVDSINELKTIKKSGEPFTPLPNALKSLAREMNMPILVTSPLTRAIERRFDHTPMLSDLMGGRTIEEAADLVLLMHSVDFYADPEISRNKTWGEWMDCVDIIVAKNRNGAVGTAKLKTERKLGIFTHINNLEYDQHLTPVGYMP